MSKIQSGMFKGTNAPKSLINYNLYRGMTDFGSLEQFNLFESGRSFLKIIQFPEFLRLNAQEDKDSELIINNALHIMEYEFKGLDGLDDMTADTIAISDGINEIQVINKVKEQSSATVTMRYQEKSGAPLVKFKELFLRGIYDPRTTFKHYNGLIEKGILEEGYENEVFTLLYWVVDRTGTKIEQAYYLLGAQFTKADLSIFNSNKGEHDFKEIGFEMTCFPARCPEATELAANLTEAMAIIRDSAKGRYSFTSNWEGKNI